MRHSEFLIIGLGISGTILSWYLHKNERSFIVMDDNDASSASRVAAGVINPVTGRRIVKTWMIETLLRFAQKAYAEIGEALQVSTIFKKNIIDFFPSPQMLPAFMERAGEEQLSLSMPVDHSAYHSVFNYDFGYGEIDPCYIVQLQSLLPAWRKSLADKDVLIENRFEEQELILQTNGVRYGDIVADKIIFCDGTSSAASKWFSKLPFALNKGEALIIRCGELPDNNIYKKGLTIVPLQDGYFWVGSSYEWEFTSKEPSEAFRDRTMNLLAHWLRVPFTIEAHLASVRPATLERRPFIGMHPHHPAIGIFNGMGTKGCSLAPYFAAQFVDHLTKKSALLPEANVNRFTRVLQST